MRKLIIRRAADAQMIAAAQWYGREGGLRLRARFAAALVAGIAATRNRPMSFPVVLQRRIGPVRRAGLSTFPYSLYFAVKDDTVILLYVRHQSRRPLRS
jgi:plasmid stabilization system protein ParE